jgi:hypothetical protein
MEYDDIYRTNGNQRICAAVKDVSHSTKERKFVDYKMCGRPYIEWNQGQKSEPWGRCPGCSRRKIE